MLNTSGCNLLTDFALEKRDSERLRESDKQRERDGEGEMERWRDGEMERWRDGEMERWRDGEMERWRDGEMERWRERERERERESSVPHSPKTLSHRSGNPARLHAPHNPEYSQMETYFEDTRLTRSQADRDDPATVAKRTAPTEYKQSPSERNLQILRAAMSKIQQTTRRCANEYWAQRCHDNQRALRNAMVEGAYGSAHISVMKVYSPTLLAL